MDNQKSVKFGRQEKWRNIFDISLYDLEDTIENTIKFLNDLKKLHENSVLRLNVVEGFESSSLQLQYKDKETDVELEAREALDKMRIKEKRDAELKELARLKEKYEN